MLKYHLFYIDTSGLLKDMILAAMSNVSTSVESWTPGNLENYHFKAPLVGGTGMSIVAVNATAFVDPVDVPNLTSFGGLLLFVGGADGLVHEYKYVCKTTRGTQASHLLVLTGMLASALTYGGALRGFGCSMIMKCY